MFKVGFAGTAKNTGKTTAVMYFLRQANIRKERVGLTGIGYDGEGFDHLTGLPKPRVICQGGCIIATAKGCLGRGTATYRILRDLSLYNALGQLYLLEIVSPGEIVIAGPNTRRDLQCTMDAFRQVGCELVLVDGAFGRLGPFAEVDGLILATGAARTPDIDSLVQDTRALEQIFALPVANTPKEIQGGNTITLFLEDGGVKKFKSASLLSRALVTKIARSVASAAVVFIPGAVPGELLWQLYRKVGKGFAGKTMVFSDPTKLLLSGNYKKTGIALEGFIGKGGRVVVKKRIPLLALVINPFYPLSTNNSFRKAFINYDILKQALAEVSGVPVINVKETRQNYYLDASRREVRVD